MKEDNIKTYNNRNGESIETPSFNLNEKNIFSQIDTLPVTKTKLEAHEFKPVDKENHKAVIEKIKLGNAVNKEDRIEYFEITPATGQGEKTTVVATTEEPITYQKIYKKIEPISGTVNKVENNTLSGKIESISAKRFTGENFPEINKNNEFVTANVSQKQQFVNLETVKAKVSDYKDGIEFFETTPMSGQGEKTHVAEVGSTEEPITYQKIYKNIEPISGTVNSKVQNNSLSGEFKSASVKQFTGGKFPEVNKNSEFVTADVSQKEDIISITDDKSDFFAEAEYVAPVLGPTENQNIESINDTIEYTAEAEYVAPVLGPTENQIVETNTNTIESTSTKETTIENNESVENPETSSDETNVDTTENTSTEGTNADTTESTSTEEAPIENNELVENPETSSDETNVDTTENTSTEGTNTDTTESTSTEEATTDNNESVENPETSSDETNVDTTENTSTEETNTDTTENTSIEEATTENNEKEIAEIVIGEKPKKLKYAQNKEYLDLSGATIFVVYADGTVEEKEISFDEVSVVGFDNTTVGKQTITLVYEGKTIDLEIEIVKAQATQSSLPSRNYNPEPEMYIDPASLLFSIEKLKRITNGGESSLQYVSQKINGIKIDPAIKKELSNLIDYSFIDTAKSDIAKIASSGDKNTSTPLSILNRLEGLKKDLLEDDPSLQSTFDLLLFANLEEFGSDMSATEKALFAEEKLESILDDYDSQISDAKTNWQEGEISYQEYLNIIKPLNETKHALEQQFDSYVFNSTLELINKPNRTAEENEILDNWYNSVTSDRFVCWDENNRESKDLYINYLNDAELYTYALISQQYATNASIEYNLPDNANEELNRLLSELNKAEEELNRSTEKYDNYSNNRFMSLYDPNYKAICDEKQETVNQAQANYDSLKRQVEDLQNSISIVSNYMEDSLYSYEILIKGIPVAERTNEQKDFLVQRQQTALSNSMNRASQEYNNYATELSEKQQRIEEIEFQRAAALQLDIENGAYYIESNHYENICKSTEDEYNALLASEQELLTNVSMWNSALSSIQTANINLFKNYSDFNDNLLSNIASYELKGEYYCQDGVECYNHYAVFYDKEGNEVDASAQEIAMYMYENEINLSKSTMNDYGLHDAMEYLNNLNYLDNYSGESGNNLDIDTLAYIMNTQSSDVFNSYFDTFNNQSVQLQGLELFNERLAKLQKNDIDTDGDSIVDVTVGGVSDSLKLIGFGLKDGVENFFNGFSNLVYGDGQVSAKEYSSMYLMDYINNTYDASTVASAAYEISNSIGNMLPSISVGWIPVVGQALSVSLMGLSSMGNSKEQALQMGMTEGQATLYGFLSGASEAALGYLLGSMPGLSNMAKFEGMHGLTGFIAKGGSEVIEEMTQEMLNPVFECIATRSKFTFDQIDMDAVLKAGVYAFITSGVMNGGSFGTEVISKTLTGDYTTISQVGSNYISSLLNGQINLPDAISNFSSDLSTLTRSKATLTDLITNLHNNPDFVASVEGYISTLDENTDVFGKNAGNTTVDDVISKVAVSSILEIAKVNNVNQAIVDGLKSQQSTLTTEMAELQEKINELESAVLDGSIDDATRVSKQTELNNLIGQFENKQIELSQISDLLENPNAVISSIDSTDMASKIMQTNFIGSAQAAIDAKKTSDMKQNLEQLSGRKQSLEESIRTLEEKISKINEEINSSNDGLNKYRIKYLQQLSTEHSNLISELANVNNRVELLKQRAEYDQAVSKVKAELESISPKLVELYEQGKISSNDLAFFLGFEEHNFLHVSRVAEESLDIVNKLNERIANGNFEGLGSIDPDIVYKSGLAHDLGMSSGGYVLCKIDGKLQLKSIEELLSKNEAGKYIYEEQIKPFLINGKFEGDIEGIVVRKMHPLNSAIQVLQNRDMFGNDTEMVAALALIHSKSTSGVKNVTSNEQLIEMLNKLELASETLGIEFDMSKFMEIDAEGNRVLREDVANSLRTGAIALRVGDAHAQKTGFNHSGDKISVDEVIPLSETEIADILNEYDTTHTISIGKIAAAEAAKAKVSIISETGTTTILEGKTTGNDYDFSRQIVLGEKNSIALPVEVTEDTIIYTIEVLSENTPACTWLNSIQEKFGEYATFGDINQEVIIKLPSNVSEQVIKLYEAFAKSYFETVKANNIASITFRVEGTDIIKSIDNPNKIQITEINTETSTQVVESEGVQEVVDLGEVDSVSTKTEAVLTEEQKLKIAQERAEYDQTVSEERVINFDLAFELEYAKLCDTLNDQQKDYYEANKDSIIKIMKEKSVSAEVAQYLMTTEGATIYDALKAIQDRDHYVKKDEKGNKSPKYPINNGAKNVVNNYTGIAIRKYISTLLGEDITGKTMTDIEKLIAKKVEAGIIKPGTIKIEMVPVVRGVSKNYYLAFKFSSEALVEISKLASGTKLIELQKGDYLTRVGSKDGSYIGTNENTLASLSIPVKDYTMLHVGRLGDKSGVYAWEEEIAPFFGEIGNGVQRYILVPDAAGYYTFRTRGISNSNPNFDYSGEQFAIDAWTPNATDLVSLDKNGYLDGQTVQIDLQKKIDQKGYDNIRLTKFKDMLKDMLY